MQQDPETEPNPEEAEGRVEVEQVTEGDAADRVCADEGRREQAKPHALLLCVQCAQDEGVELVGCARDDAAVHVVDQVDEGDKEDHEASGWVPTHDTATKAAKWHFA